MKAYLLVLDCPQCGRTLNHVNAGVEPTYAIAILRCDHCPTDYVMSIALRTRYADAQRQAGGPGSKPRGRREVYA